MPDLLARRIRARFLVVDAETVIEDGWVALTEDGVVRAIGSVRANADKEGGYFDEEVDGIVAAAVVNAHCHIEFGAEAGAVPGGDGLNPWVQRLMAAVRARPGGAREAGMERSAAALAQAGCGWVADICNSGDSGPVLAGHGLRGVVFHELLDPVPGRAAQTVETANSKAGPRDPAFPRRPAPHTPFSCAPDLLELLLAEAAADAPVSLHLAEDPAEAEFLCSGAGPWSESLRKLGWTPEHPVPGKRSVPWLDELGLLGPGLLAVHLTDATADELRLLAEREVRAVLCPSSNLHIQDRLPDLPAVLEAGLRPGLGTDSPAAHPDLSPRRDSALLAERFPQIPPAVLWNMLTRWGAESLGIAEQAGSLWPGRAPGLLACDCEAGEDPLAVLTAMPDRPLRRLALPGPPPEDA